MAEFNSWLSYYQFAQAVKSQRRYMRDSETEHFLQTVLTTSFNRQEVAPSGTHFFRAQLGCEIRREGPEEIYPYFPFCPERMIPLCDRAREGRANPKGIPYLYLAVEKDTAIAEVRPWVGSFVSIAQFALKREIRVVNCVTGQRESLLRYDDEPPPDERERFVWQHIDRALSRPLTTEDDSADYAPTQVIAEFFRENELDGIAYGSSLGPGHNVALFDIDVASVVNCGVVQIKRMKFEYSAASNTYSVPDMPKSEKDGV